MIGLYFKGASENYQMHIGQLKYTSGQNLTPDAPTGLTIDKAYDTNEMVVSWDLGEYDSVKQYNCLCRNQRGRAVHGRYLRRDLLHQEHL